MSFLGIEGFHAFVTGAQGGIGSAIVAELLAGGCKVTAHDLRAPKGPDDGNIFHVDGDVSDEASISAAIASAEAHFGPINILCANAGITNEASHANIWELSLETWSNVYRVNSRGTFLTVKHFLLAAKRCQDRSGQQLDNLAVVITGSECGKFGQAGHVEYASGKAGLQYGLVPTVKNEIVKLNAKGRINAVAPGWVNTELIGNRLDDAKEAYYESQATVALKKIAEPVDVAKTVAFLASHRASGHMSGQCLSVDGGMEGRAVWREEEVQGRKPETAATKGSPVVSSSIPQQLSLHQPKPKITVALSVDFDAVSGWLGTGAHPDNNTSDYSAGFFAGNVGVPRLLKVLRKLNVADKTTWCIPGHSIETFPEAARAIAATNCEIAVHGYAHESAAQLSAEQERAVLARSITLIENLTGTKPIGYRAPLYQLNERTITLLQEQDFLWDSSLSHHDSEPYFLPLNPIPLKPIDFSLPAETWMHASPNPFSPATPKSSLVELPCNWYAEDATPLQFFPHNANSAGYVDVRVIERMWRDRFEWLERESGEAGGEERVFALVLHPDTSGMAHVVGMVERFLLWVRGREGVEFSRCGDLAWRWRERDLARGEREG